MGLIRPKYKDRHGNLCECRIWYMSFSINGKYYRESTGTRDKKKAQEKEDLRKAELRCEGPIGDRTLTFSDLAELVTNEYENNGKRSIGDLEARLRLHILPVFSERKAMEITPADISHYTNRRKREKAGNGTINRELTVIKRAFSLGTKMGLIPHAPYIPMLEEPPAREGFFEREQFESVLKHLPDDLQPLVTFAYITGARSKSEIFTLQWRQVDFEAQEVRWERGTTKNKEGKTFPFTLELRALLEAQRSKTDEIQRARGVIIPWVFHRDGEPIREMKRAWKSTCKAAGVPRRVMHDFRRTAVRSLERAGVSRSVAMKMRGHKTESVYRRNAIVSQNDLHEAARKLERMNG